MPQAANLTVNNAAAVAKTFTLLNPSAGLNSEARWALKEGLNSSVFPRLSAVLRTDTSVKGTAGVFKVTFPQSYTDASTGLVKRGSAAELVITNKIPDDWPESLKADWKAYVKNLVAHADVQVFLEGGSAFT
jgi:predicted transcriptional regulator